MPTSRELEEQLSAVVSIIDHAKSFLVVAHASPDGDAVGSTLAMGLLLEQLGKHVCFYNQDPVPYNFQFLPGADRWTTELGAEESFDVTIMLDCAERDRIGTSFPKNGWGKKVVVIDHHKTWDPSFADAYLRDVDAAATGELLFRLVSCMGSLSTEIAQNLYCCMMTDTGSFRYSNTSRTAFRIAGELVEAGADAWHMTSHIYEDQPRSRLDLLCRVLATLAMSPCGRLAFLRVEQSMFDDAGGTSEMTDGFINYARSIRGVEVATQLREAGPDTWRISFRSRGKVDVSSLAAKFGGGGHHNAAGCEMHGTWAEVQQRLSEALVELLGD
ncbi:MAG: DHH family phosphoesterase [Bradymonadaceae bacterium]|nr:DHH family phosphoesterase [Lujinxingiaceae bacterium]